MPSDENYSDVADTRVPLPTVRRRERVLGLFRSADDAILTTAQLVEHLRRNRMPDYNLGLAYKDLDVLRSHGFVRDYGGWPRRWGAV
jgi:Fe2+ or Zn2+ uptake regulation protein